MKIFILDDLIVDALERPIVFALVLAGLWYAKSVLTLSQKAATVYSQILGALIVIVVAMFIIRLTNAIISNYVQPMTKNSKYRIDSTMYQVLIRIVNVVVYIVAIIIVLQNLGYQVSGLLAGLGIGGLAFALAAQDILGNMFGGMAVVADKPFKVGDRVKVAGQDGFISKISLRTTTIETFGKTHVVMPNKLIVDSVLENVSREDMRRERIVLGLEYDTTAKELEKAKKLLADIVLKNSKTDDNSMIHFTNFGPSSLDIQVIYWIKDLNEILSTKDEIHMEIKKQFDKAGFSFAFPTQTVHVKK